MCCGWWCGFFLRLRCRFRRGGQGFDVAGIAAGDSGEGDVVCVVVDGAFSFDDALLMALGDFYVSAGDVFLEVVLEG